MTERYATLGRDGESLRMLLNWDPWEADGAQFSYTRNGKSFECTIIAESHKPTFLIIDEGKFVLHIPIFSATGVEFKTYFTQVTIKHYRSIFGLRFRCKKQEVFTLKELSHGMLELLLAILAYIGQEIPRRRAELEREKEEAIIRAKKIQQKNREQFLGQVSKELKVNESHGGLSIAEGGLAITEDDV